MVRNSAELFECIVCFRTLFELHRNLQNLWDSLKLAGKYPSFPKRTWPFSPSKSDYLRRCTELKNWFHQIFQVKELVSNQVILDFVQKHKSERFKDGVVTKRQIVKIQLLSARNLNVIRTGKKRKSN